MGSRRTPTRADHQRFCETEGWELVRDARGRTGTHHLTYELALPDGRRLRTRISHPPDRTDIGAALFAHILRDQLGVNAEDFWACVRGGVPPDRGRPPTPAASLPADLVHALIRSAGVPESEVRTLTRDEAIARMQAHWSGTD